MNPADRNLIRAFCKKFRYSYASARKAWGDTPIKGREDVRKMMRDAIESGKIKAKV